MERLLARLVFVKILTVVFCAYDINDFLNSELLVVKVETDIQASGGVVKFEHTSLTPATYTWYIWRNSGTTQRKQEIPVPVKGLYDVRTFTRVVTMKNGMKAALTNMTWSANQLGPHMLPHVGIDVIFLDGSLVYTPQLRWTAPMSSRFYFMQDTNRVVLPNVVRKMPSLLRVKLNEEVNMKLEMIVPRESQDFKASCFKIRRMNMDRFLTMQEGMEEIKLYDPSLGKKTAAYFMRSRLTHEVETVSRGSLIRMTITIRKAGADDEGLYFCDMSTKSQPWETQLLTFSGVMLETTTSLLRQNDMYFFFDILNGVPEMLPNGVTKVSVPVGYPAVFQCRISTISALTEVRLMKDDRPLSLDPDTVTALHPGGLTFTYFTYVIKSPSNRDNGKYTCGGSNQHTTRNKSIQVEFK